MPTAELAEAVVGTVVEALKELYSFDEFEELDKEILFSIVVGCLAVARNAAVVAQGSDAAAKDWFQKFIAERWQDQGT